MAQSVEKQGIAKSLYDAHKTSDAGKTNDVSKTSKGLSNARLKTIGLLALACGAMSSALAVRLGAGAGGLQAASTGQLGFMIAGELISWIAMPIYAWLVVQGFQHTRSAYRYGLRLLAVALVAEVPYDLATSGVPWDWRSQNPVFALAIALIMVGIMESVRRRDRLLRSMVWMVAFIAAVVWSLVLRIGVRQQFLNLGMVIVAFAAVWYLLQAHENTMMLMGGLLGALVFMTPAIGVALLHYRNDELGYRHAWARWAYYAAYPLLLLVCAGVALLS